MNKKSQMIELHLINDTVLLADTGSLKDSGEILTGKLWDGRNFSLPINSLVYSVEVIQC